MVWKRRTLVASLAVLAVLFLGLLAGFAYSQQGGTPSQPAAGTPLPQATQAAQPAVVAAPKLSVPAQAVMQEGELLLSGQGFAPGEQVSIAAGKGEDAVAELGTVTADEEGNWGDVSFDLPASMESGTYELQAKGEESERTAGGTLYVRAPKGWIQLQDYVVRVGNRLGLIAGGFGPKEQVNLYLTAGQDRPGELPAQPLATMTADPAGNTDWSDLQLPVLDPGRYALLLRGDDSQVEVLRVIEIQPLIPLLQLNPWSGPPGSSITLSAQGFTPGEAVRVYLGGGNEAAAEFTADQYGNLADAGPIAIPGRTGGGQVAVFLEGAQSRARISQNFSVIGGQNNAWLVLSQYAGAPGARIYFSGGGFGSGEKVTVHLGDRGGPEVASAETAADGSFERVGPTTVPANGNEDVGFTIVGEASGAEARATFKVLRAPEQPRP